MVFSQSQKHLSRDENLSGSVVKDLNKSKESLNLPILADLHRGKKGCGFVCSLMVKSNISRNENLSKSMVKFLTIG